uniref:Uncharacterized protein n=1 Tax=Romanomermis culicivorax TaxID=13658 RepID=A0A915HK52_ROMCU
MGGTFAPTASNCQAQKGALRLSLEYERKLIDLCRRLIDVKATRAAMSYRSIHNLEKTESLISRICATFS